MHIFTLKETFALLVSGLTSFYLNYCSVYLKWIARSWSYTIYLGIGIERNLFLEKNISLGLEEGFSHLLYM